MESPRQFLADAARRVRTRWRPALARIARLTTASLASYLIALHIVDDRRPVTAALTALLIVQVTLVGTITDTIRRIVSVIAGVAVAIGVSTLVGFTWWSLGGVIALSVLVGQFLRLGPHLLEVPISAMLILAAGGAGVQATDRVYETLIGAAAGLLINVVAPPVVQTRSAGAAVDRFATSIARLLERAGSALTQREASADEVRSWLSEVRAITDRVGDVERALARASESRRLNPRAVGTQDITPDLRSGLSALEHSAVALRAVFRSIADGIANQDEAQPNSIEDDDLRMAIATLLDDLAQAIRAYGALIHAEVDQADQPHTEEVAGLLDAVREARVRLTELLLVDPQVAPGRWELHGSLLAGVERVIAELDVAERMRRRDARRREAAALRRPASIAAERMRERTRKAMADAPVRMRPPRRG